MLYSSLHSSECWHQQPVLAERCAFAERCASAASPQTQGGFNASMKSSVYNMPGRGSHADGV